MSNKDKSTFAIANGTVIFLLEVLMVIAFGWYGYNKPNDPWLRAGMAAEMVVAVIVLWAIFAAPKSEKRLPLPALAIFRGVMLLAAAL